MGVFSGKKDTQFLGSPGEVLLLVREDLHLDDREAPFPNQEAGGFWRDYALQMTNDSTLIASHEYGFVNRNTVLFWRRNLFACLSSLASQTVPSGTA